MRYKEGCMEITLLAELAGSREAIHRGMKSLEFLRLHPKDMAVPYFR